MSDESGNRDQRIEQIVALLGDANRHREFARWLVGLEERCDRLAAELARVDQRLTKARLDRWDIP